MCSRRIWASTVTLLTASALAVLPASAGAAPAVVPKPLCCIPTNSVDAIAVSGNTAYIGGSFHRMGRPTHHLAVLETASGDTETGLPGVDGGYVRTSVPDGNGGWYIGGTFTSVGGVARAGLAHVLADKSVDPNWAPSTNGQVNGLVRAFGAVYAGGNFSQVNGGTARFDVAAFDEATGAVTSFTADTDGFVNALGLSVRCSDLLCTGTVGRLYIGGSFTTVDLVGRHNLAATDLAGNVVGTGDPNVGGTVNALAVGSTGPLKNAEATVYVGGNFSAIDPSGANVPRGNGARFDEDADTLDMGWDPKATGVITAMALNATNVYVGGGFAALGPSLRTRLGAVDRTTGAATSWDPTVSLSSVMTTLVDSIVYLDGVVYVGGRFDRANTTVERQNLVAFDAVTAEITPWDPDPTGRNFAIQYLGTDGTSLITSGEFETIGGPERHHIAAIDLSSGQVTPFNPDLDGHVGALAVQGSTLYAGGTFMTAGGSTARHRAAAFDLTSGQLTAFDPDLNGEVLSVAPAGGTVILGGLFTQAAGGTAPRARIAEVDAQSGAPTAFRPDPNGEVRGLAVNGDTVFAGGAFTDFGGAAREGLAAVRLIPGTLGAVTPFNGGLNTGGTVQELLLHGSTLYATGVFTQFAGAPRVAFGAVDTGTNLATGFNPNGSLEGTGLAASDTEVFTVGQFSQIGGATRPGLAALDPRTGTATDWLPPVPSGAVMGSIGSSPEAGVVAGGLNQTSHMAQGVLLALALQPTTPAAPQATAGDAQASVAFSAPPDGGSPITQYRVTASPGGQTATGTASPISVGGLANGTSYTFTVSAANAAGESPQSPPSNAVTPGVASGPTPGLGPGAGTSAALTATGFRVTNKRFKVGKKRTALNARTRTGTTFVFRLSADATSRIAIARKLPGRRKGKRCVAPRQNLKKRCTRYVKAGTLVRQRTRAAVNRVAFTGRMGKRALRPGTYRATLTASDANGRRSKPASLTFRVVRR